VAASRPVLERIGTHTNTRSGVSAGVTELDLAFADDASFEAWYRRTVPRVFSFLMSRSGADRDLSEELTQQTYTAAIEQRSRFDGRSDSVTWLCGIARHKLVDHLRKGARVDRRRIRMEVRQIELAVFKAPLEIDDRELIAKAFRALPSDQRSVLALVAFDGLSIGEAAQVLGKKAGATQSLLHRAREGFRRAHAQEMRDE